MTPGTNRSARRRNWRLVAVAVYALLLLTSKVYQRGHHEAESFDVSRVEVPLPQRGGAPAQGVEFAYREWNPDCDGVPVLLLHGSPGAAQDFDTLGPLLASGGVGGVGRDAESTPLRRRVIAPDLLGYGGTRGSFPGRSIDAYATMMLTLMDRLEIPRVHVVGWSNGGGVALNMADLAPDRIVSLTMLASIGLQEHEPSGSSFFEHAKYKAAKAVLGAGPELMPHFGLLGTYESRTAWIDFFDDSDQRELGTVMERVGQRGTPTLILHGKHDFLVPVLAARDHFQRIASSRLVILEASHFIPFLQASEASAELGGWFAAAEKAGSTPGAAPWRRVEDRSQPDQDSWTAGLFATLTVAVRATPWWAQVAAVVIVGPLVGAVVGAMLVVHATMDPFVLLAGLVPAFAARDVVRRIRCGAKGMGKWTMAGRALRQFVWCVGAVVCLVLLEVLAFGPVRARSGGGVLEGVLLGTGLLGGLGVVWLLFHMPTRAGRHHVRVSLERLVHHEYWPTHAFYSLFYPRLLWMAATNGGLRQVTCCNPEIEHGGGWAGESKHAIIERLKVAGDMVLATHLVPPMASARERVEHLKALMAQNPEIASLPIVLKPNEAQRGHAFKLLRTMEQAEPYLASMTGAAVAQAYHPGPEECGLFWMRYSRRQVEKGHGPDGRPIVPGRRGFVYSATRKEFPVVVGDGKRSLQRLVQEHPRYRRQEAIFLTRLKNETARVPAAGEKVRLSISGNHCQGTLFRDGADLVTPLLEAEVDRIASCFPRLDYGRFDVRYTSESELKMGRGLVVIELNGASAEPTSMYDPDRSYIWALSVLAGMWRQVFELAKERRAEGVRPLSYSEFIRTIRQSASNLTGSSIAD